jgi:hypothetical protein
MQVCTTIIYQWIVANFSLVIKKRRILGGRNGDERLMITWDLARYMTQIEWWEWNCFKAWQKEFPDWYKWLQTTHNRLLPLWVPGPSCWCRYEEACCRHMLSARHSGASLSAAYQRATVGPRTVQGGLPAYSSAEPRRINDIRADLRGFYFLHPFHTKISQFWSTVTGHIYRQQSRLQTSLNVRLAWVRKRSQRTLC